MLLLDSKSSKLSGLDSVLRNRDIWLLPPTRRSVCVQDGPASKNYFLSFPPLLMKLYYYAYPDTLGLGIHYRRCFVGFADEKREMVYLPPLPNIDRDNLLVCMEIPFANDPKQLARNAVEAFFATSFNRTLIGSGHDAYVQADRWLGSLDAWQDRTQADPGWCPRPPDLLLWQSYNSFYRMI